MYVYNLVYDSMILGIRKAYPQGDMCRSLGTLLGELIAESHPWPLLYRLFGRYQAHFHLNFDSPDLKMSFEECCRDSGYSGEKTGLCRPRVNEGARYLWFD